MDKGLVKNPIVYNVVLFVSLSYTLVINVLAYISGGLMATLIQGAVAFTLFAFVLFKFKYHKVFVKIWASIQMVAGLIGVLSIYVYLLTGGDGFSFKSLLIHHAHLFVGLILLLGLRGNKSAAVH